MTCWPSNWPTSGSLWGPGPRATKAVAELISDGIRLTERVEDGEPELLSIPLVRGH
jgi:hypothetical protein